MQSPNGWIAGSLTLGFVLALAVRPGPPPAERSISLPTTLAPHVPIALQGCSTIDARLEFERGDCLQATRLELLEGRITLIQAIRRIEACAGGRSDLAELTDRATSLRAAGYRARVAFGDELSTSDAAEFESLREVLGDVAPAPSWESVERLRAVGIGLNGFDPGREEAILERLARSRSLRNDFRAVFGEERADDLEAILRRDSDARAVIAGGTVIVPNLTPALPIEGGSITISEEETDPLAVPLEAYAARVVADLAAFERARGRFLASAAREDRRTGSIEAFLASVRDFREEDTEGPELRERVERDAATLLARMTNLQRQLGLEPLLYRSAEESVALVALISRECEEIARGRGRWVRNGSRVAVGLLGAAGVVLASGSTGTLMGGLILAAAIEATAGAFLIARSERIAESRFALREAAEAPMAITQRRAPRPYGSLELADGRAGTGGGEHENWFEDDGILREWEGLGGEGVEDEGGEATGSTPRENTVPPVLPPAPEEDVRELPPILDTPLLQQLRDLTLPEIQERLDEFLARRDPATLASFTEEAIVEPLSTLQMVEEAQASLNLWEERRVLSERFGGFFVQAELARATPNDRGDILLRAMGRYLHDREMLAGSRDVDDLRRRVASRMVAHCRAGNSAGDLVLRACTDETALSILLVAALRDTGTPIPEGGTLGIQAFDSRFEAVVHFRDRNEVYSLTRGSPMEGVVAPIYHPAMFYYTYLLMQGVVPDIDVDQHLLVALPDRPMPAELRAEECEQHRSVLGRAVDWLGSMIGVRRLATNDPCRPGDEDRIARSGGDRGGERTIGLNVPMPNPLQRSGGGQSGGSSRGGGGGGGGQPFAEGQPDPMGSGASGGGSSSQSGDGEGETGSGERDEGSSTAGESGSERNSEGSAGNAEGQESGEAEGSGGVSEGADGALASAERESEAGAVGAATEEGGYSRGVASIPEGPNLNSVGREAARLAREYERAPSLRVQPWRLREDEGMMTGSDIRVLYADNARALQRFDEDDLFITLAPAEVEAQRRMLEADTFPLFDANATCDSPGLPPRRVFRRVAAGEAGFRYVYCDQDESMVIFRDRNDANSYAGLSPPDRPLFLARLGAERLARFERTEEVARLKEFLADPNMLRRHSREEIYAMVKAAADLLVFQNTLESALVQSMNELGPSVVRGHYYEMHRQVLQAPLFISMAESVYRLNQRLASDPLQSLAWANAQPRLARQGFFDLYHTLGGMMAWPDRWAVLQQRYGDGAPPATETTAASSASLDFLQIMSDPVRVQVDWNAERTGAPSIRDRQVQDGVERTTEEMDMPTLSELPEREEETEHRRGGTGGLGLAGEGESMGPEEGRRPLQMIRIRVVREDGEPDRPRVPDDNQVRPGGTRGEKRTQTEESASRQEAVLWVSPQTFIEAILSPWDPRELQPASADRIPPILRFNERLRDVFLRDLRPTGVYDNRLRTAMGVFSRSGWLQYSEVRDAVGGDVLSVRAIDTGRFSAAYSGNPPINDQDQIRIPNFFSDSGVLIPADLFAAVREHYTESLLGIFDLSSNRRVPAALSIRSLPLAPTEAARDARNSLLWSLDMITDQAVATD